MIRHFTIKDYDEVYALWNRTPGVGLRSLDDSREGIERFILKNPNTNFVAVESGKLIGVTLSGHDGRRGYIYHTCVEEESRRRSIGRQLINEVIRAMKEEGITKLSLVCFAENEKGNNFWNSLGWSQRKDLNYYNVSINNDNK